MSQKLSDDVIVKKTAACNDADCIKDDAHSSATCKQTLEHGLNGSKQVISTVNTGTVFSIEKVNERRSSPR